MRLLTRPDSLSTLSDLMNKSRKVFPGDPFFPVRDMSFIRPTKFGTLEFRSSCSFRDLNLIIEIANWRVAQVILAFAGKIDPTKIDQVSWTARAGGKYVRRLGFFFWAMCSAPTN